MKPSSSRPSLGEMAWLFYWETLGALDYFRFQRPKYLDEYVQYPSGWFSECLAFCILVAVCVRYSGAGLSFTWVLNRLPEVHGLFRQSEREDVILKGRDTQEKAERKSRSGDAFSLPSPWKRRRRLTSPESDIGSLWPFYSSWTKARDTDAQEQSSLFRLPFELRQTIWRYHFDAQRHTHVKRQTYQSHTHTYVHDEQMLLHMNASHPQPLYRLATSSRANILAFPKTCRRA